MKEKIRCPICKNMLQRKKIGYVCKNFKCDLYWKLNIGWSLQTNEMKY